MAGTISRSPWMGTVTLTTANTAYQLSALLAGLGANAPRTTLTPRCQYIAIQADPNAGGAKFYVGNENLATTFCGIQLFATQVWPIYSMDSNLIMLDSIYLMCDTSGKVMNLTMITR